MAQAKASVGLGSPIPEHEGQEHPIKLSISWCGHGCLFSVLSPISSTIFTSKAISDGLSFSCS